MSNQQLSNTEKARQIVARIIELDYGGDLAAFQDENGWDEGVRHEIYFWLEDGNGDGRTVDECRLLYELL